MLSYSTITASTTSTTSAQSICGNADYLVVDTGPLVSGHNLHRVANKLFTIPEVIAEVKDKKSRAVLDNVQLTIRQPTEEAMYAIINFSKLTGDFAALSMTDIKVMALAYTLEKERNGVAHLKTTPESRTAMANTKNPIIYSSGKRLNTPQNMMAKKTQPATKTTLAPKSTMVNNQKVEQTAVDEVVNNIEQLSINDNNATQQLDTESAVKDAPVEIQSTEQLSEDSTEEVAEPVTPNTTSPLQQPMDATPNKPKVVKKNSDDDDTDSDGEWITPDNLEQHKRRDQGLDSNSSRDAQKVDVACMTADFAMQNVVIQMGLHLMSMDGMVIKQVKTWVLRCHACYKITTDMEKQFCPSCGNNTLLRVSAGLDKQGNLCVYLKDNFQYNIRGTKYNISKPQGGKHNNDLILCEDERAYQIAVHRNRRKGHQDLFDPDYIPAMLQGDSGRTSKNSMPAIGHGRRNPNASRRGGKSKRR
ncbi:Nin one binding Zn-ribbon like-domain-containing protein [Syncephalis fuscata]|nr:Nin one binding Zn-ribbon like-domain-containing protein [Syncephalis fuscata]